MKKLFVYKKYACHRFDEATNEIVFDYEIIANRPMTPAEQKKYKRLHTAGVAFSVLGLLCIVAGLTLIILSACILPDWFGGVGLACILSTAFPLPSALQYGSDAERMKEKDLLKVGFEAEDSTYESLEKYVKDSAEAWRAAHPLEEKIRIAQKSGNCVDIAELVKYCGADLVDKLK